jgi:hypothetical protein
MSLPGQEALAADGLNLLAVLAVADLPAALRAPLAGAPGAPPAPRLVLVGNAGPALWRTVQAAGIASDDPIDDFSRARVDRWLDALPGCHWRHWLFPGDAPVGLQALGEVAGWHHPAPFRVGIQPGWGSWFAYRAAVLVDAPLAPTPALTGQSPCAACSARPCVTACPAGALAGGDFDLEACLDWRLAAGSSCADTCLARLACPVGAQHRYDTAQIRHAYGHSLHMLRHWRTRAASRPDR